jgi:CBS domain-containing protein
MVRKIQPDVIDRQEVLKLSPETTVREAAREMAKRDNHSVLVVEGDSLLGIFTAADVSTKVVAAGLDPNMVVLRQVMTQNPQTIDASDNVIEALRKMQLGHFRHLPVTKDGKVVGVVSRKDCHGYEIDHINWQQQIWEKL